MDVLGKVALVTSAAAGIGRAVATAPVEAGAGVGQRAVRESGCRFAHVLTDDDCRERIDTPAVARRPPAMSDAERMRVPELVPDEEIACLVLGLIRDDDALLGRVIIRAWHDGSDLLPLDGP